MDRNELEAFGLERLDDYTDVWVELMEAMTREADTVFAIILRRDFIEFPELAEELRDGMAKALAEYPEAGNAYDAFYGSPEYDFSNADVLAILNGLDFVPADKILGSDIVLMVDEL